MYKMLERTFKGMGSNRYLIEWSPTKTRKRAISVNCREIGCRPVIGWIIVVDLAGQASFHIFRFALTSECKLQIMNELLENGILLAKQKQLFVSIHSKKETTYAWILSGVPNKLGYCHQKGQRQATEKYDEHAPYMIDAQIVD